MADDVETVEAEEIENFQHIIGLNINNVMKLKAVHLRPEAGKGLVVIGGENAQGKTAVLESVRLAFLGAKAGVKEIVRRGESKADIEVETEDLVIRRDYKPGKNPKLVVSSKETGEIKRPQQHLDRVIGKISFDPLAWANMEPKKAEKILRDILGLDFTELDANRKHIYDGRTNINREIRDLEGQIEAIPSDPSLPADEFKITDLVAELKKRRDHNANAERILARYKLAEDGIAEADKAVEQAALDLEECRAWLSRAKAEADEAAKDIPNSKEQDESEIESAMEKADETNKRIREQNRLRKLEHQLATQQGAADELTAQIEQIDHTKAKKMAAAKFPVEGMGLDERGVTYNDIPFDQASSAEKLKVSVAMGARLNPKVRVMLIQDGSLLDESSMEWVNNWAVENRYQILMERVGKSDGDIIIEAGEAIKGGATGQSTPTGLAEPMGDPSGDVEDLNDLFSKF